MKTKLHKKITIDTNQTLDSLLHQVLNIALVACEAEAGSLMLVDNERGILQIKARLGSPRAGRTQEPIYGIGDGSIAGWVAKHKRTYLCPDVSKDKFFAASRSGHYFKSLISVPIVHSGKVLAVINADSKGKNYFSALRCAKLERVARKSSKPIADRISIADALAEIGVELTRLPKRGGVDSVLSIIANLALRALGADVITLYQFNQEKDMFPVEGRGPTVAGELRHPGPMRRRVYPGDVPWTVVKERKSGFYPNVEDEAFLRQHVERPGESTRPRFIEREGIKSMAALLLPFRAAEIESEEVVGVMFANYRVHHQFDIDETAALATFADYAAVAILNARVEEQHYTEQMRMVEAMAANFAHRMGNLGGACNVVADTLADRIQSTDRVGLNALGHMRQRAKVLLELAERLAKPFKETGHMFELKPLGLLAILDEELRELPTSKIEISLDRGRMRELPPVMSVKFQLRQVLHDLLSNAVEALKITKDPKLGITATCNPDTKKVELEIADNGSGIPNNVRERLFSPGATTKEGKLGIGLWWSRTFMQATGGNLVLKHSEVGRGTTFLVEIPCSDEYKGANPRKPPNKTKDILLVEDNELWLGPLLDNLSNENYKIDTASSYSEAVKRLVDSAYTIAVIDLRLVDADPKNIGGMELLAHIANSGIKTKVIILSAFGFEQHEKIAKQWPNFVAFYRKQNIDMKVFRNTIKTIVRAGKTTSIKPPIKG